MPDLLTERQGHTLIVTLNRPEKKNAFSPDMLAGMCDAWDLANSDDSIRSVILTATGNVFCAGADLKAMNNAQDQSDSAKRFREDAGLAWKALLRSVYIRVPIIAAVEGQALAGGTEILQATDIRVAGESAIFGVVEVMRGLFPLGGSTVRLRRQIGFTKAMELLLAAETLTAQEAKEVGLIGRVVPDGEALNEALRIAEKINSNGPLAVRAVKRSVYETNGLTEEEALKIEMGHGLPIFQTKDAKEGTLAFMEKRPAVFTGE
jgi:enoyl-CoA hydratase